MAIATSKTLPDSIFLFDIYTAKLCASSSPGRKKETDTASHDFLNEFRTDIVSISRHEDR